MNKAFRTTIALSAVVLFAAALPMAAAEIETLRVTVPFAFTAGTATLPAGDYVVSQQSDPHVLTIAGKGGDAMVVVWPGGSTSSVKTATLTFERTSKGNMLTGVNMSGSASDLVRFRPAVK